MPKPLSRHVVLRVSYFLLAFLIPAASVNAVGAEPDSPKTQDKNLFARDNLVAWCIVPFDGKKRGPTERAAMCAKLGLKKIAYDWRAGHICPSVQGRTSFKKHHT